MSHRSFQFPSWPFFLFCCACLLQKPLLAHSTPLTAAELKQKIHDTAVLTFSATEIKDLREFYTLRQYQPVWRNDKSSSAPLESAMQLIATANADGLDERDYHLPQLRQLRQQIDRTISDAYELELRTTHALLQLAQDLAHGRLSVKATDPDWHIPRPGFNAAVFLHEAIASDRLRQAFESLSPQHPGYRLLKQTLARYRELAANNTQWIRIPAVSPIHPGDTDAAIPLIRQRIAQAYVADGIAAYQLAPNQNQHYDDALAVAIRTFQEQHGLNGDGVIGQNTLQALNSPLDWKIRQLRINMERWRWLPRDLGKRHLLINTAGFVLSAAEDDHPILEMRIIVGRDYRSTPSFNSVISHLIVNPYWNVPASIARKDLLPKQQQNPNFFASSGFEIYPANDRTAHAIDPDTIDWQRYGQNFPFFLRQRPGEHNALGKVKFMFDNPFSIYLHDTPAKSLFRRDIRTFSSGCIRLEKPLELAAFALQQPELLEKFNADITGDATITLHLPEPLPVYLVYITAWAEEAGKWVHFYPDIYDRDLRALRYAGW